MTSTDQVAVVIASVSLSVSIVGMIWQLALYRLSGARIRIAITRAVMTHRGMILVGHRGQWPVVSTGAASLQEGDLWVELAKVDIANIGRTAIWASDIGIDFGADGSFKRRFRMRASCRPLAIAGSLANNASRRLEPGEAVVMYVPLVEMIKWARNERRSSHVIIRGTATLAGRRAELSPWRHALRVRKGDSGRLPHQQATDEVLVYQALVDHWPTSDVRCLYKAWLDVWNGLLPESHEGALEEALASYLDSTIESVTLASRLRRMVANRLPRAS
jgi:hypothetical protein